MNNTEKLSFAHPAQLKLPPSGMDIEHILPSCLSFAGDFPSLLSIMCQAPSPELGEVTAGSGCPSLAGAVRLSWVLPVNMWVSPAPWLSGENTPFAPGHSWLKSPLQRSRAARGGWTALVQSWTYIQLGKTKSPELKWRCLRSPLAVGRFGVAAGCFS